MKTKDIGFAFAMDTDGTISMSITIPKEKRKEFKKRVEQVATRLSQMQVWDRPKTSTGKTRSVRRSARKRTKL